MCVLIALGLCAYVYKKNLKILTFRSPGRFLFEFNRLQYTLAAPEVFVAFANHVSLPSGYRVSIVRNTNSDRSKPHPYGIVDMVEHAYSTAAEL